MDSAQTKINKQKAQNPSQLKALMRLVKSNGQTDIKRYNKTEILLCL